MLCYNVKPLGLTYEKRKYAGHPDGEVIDFQPAYSQVQHAD